ncbi:MAG: hypothetical protein HZB61_02955 [Nitrospirae bacterium]|nr:hypothetical protein [Nitrospirota bacterium]
MYWIVIIIAFVVGGFIGIAVMSALFVSRREEDKMNGGPASFARKEMQEKIRENII